MSPGGKGQFAAGWLRGGAVAQLGGGGDDALGLGPEAIGPERAQRRPFDRGGVVARARLAGAPRGRDVDQGIVVEDAAVAVPLDRIDHVHDAQDLDPTMDCGAYFSRVTPIIPALTGVMMTGVYDIRHVRARAIGVFTNKVWSEPYRGAGRPEAAYFLERAVDNLKCGKL